MRGFKLHKTCAGASAVFYVLVFLRKCFEEVRLNI